MRTLTPKQEYFGVLAIGVAAVAILVTAGSPAWLVLLFVAVASLRLAIGMWVRSVDRREGRDPSEGLRMFGLYGFRGLAWWEDRRHSRVEPPH